jgi:hypothetical protein
MVMRQGMAPCVLSVGVIAGAGSLTMHRGGYWAVSRRLGRSLVRSSSRSAAWTIGSSVRCWSAAKADGSRSGGGGTRSCSACSCCVRMSWCPVIASSRISGGEPRRTTRARLFMSTSPGCARRSGTRCSKRGLRATCFMSRKGSSTCGAADRAGDLEQALNGRLIRLELLVTLGRTAAAQEELAVASRLARELRRRRRAGTWPFTRPGLRCSAVASPRPLRSSSTQNAGESAPPARRSRLPPSSSASLYC